MSEHRETDRLLYAETHATTAANILRSRQLQDDDTARDAAEHLRLALQWLDPSDPA